MSDSNNTGYEAPSPAPDLRDLDRLVGTWQVSGEAEGTTRYEWMEGGFFLFQHVDLEQFGQAVRGVEIIGHEREFGQSPSEEITSRYFDNTGNTFRYVYEIEGDTLTIWGGEKGSPAYYKGTFSEDGNTLTGGWVYPGGGGYDSTARRVADEST